MVGTASHIFALISLDIYVAMRFNQALQASCIVYKPAKALTQHAMCGADIAALAWEVALTSAR